MLDDRRVHARFGYAELVRYDRAGKWFKEYRHPQGHRQRLMMSDVIYTAHHWQRVGGKVFYGVPGGGAFDRKMKKVA